MLAPVDLSDNHRHGNVLLLHPLLEQEAAHCSLGLFADVVAEVDAKEIVTEGFSVYPSLVELKEREEERTAVQDPVGVGAVEEGRPASQVIAVHEVHDPLQAGEHMVSDVQSHSEGQQVAGDSQKGNDHLAPVSLAFEQAAERVLYNFAQLMRDEFDQGLTDHVRSLLSQVHQQLGRNVADLALCQNEEVAASQLVDFPAELREVAGIDWLVVEVNGPQRVVVEVDV